MCACVCVCVCLCVCVCVCKYSVCKYRVCMCVYTCSVRICVWLKIELFRDRMAFLFFVFAVYACKDAVYNNI